MSTNSNPTFVTTDPDQEDVAKVLTDEQALEAEVSSETAANATLQTEVNTDASAITTLESELSADAAEIKTLQAEVPPPASTGTTGTTGTTTPSALFPKFSVPLTANATLDPNSATMVTTTTVGVKTTGYSWSVNNGIKGLSRVTAHSTDPVVTINANGIKGSGFLSDTGTSLNLPANAWIPSEGLTYVGVYAQGTSYAENAAVMYSGSLYSSSVINNTTTPGANGSKWILLSDMPVSVYNATTGALVELWQVIRDAQGNLWASYGGKIANAATSNGQFPSPYGVSASGLAYWPMVITQADAQAGAIDHIMCFGGYVSTSPQVLPATRCDSGTTAGAPHEGNLFRLSATLAMPSGLTPFAQMVFKALQNYGMIFADEAGAYALQVEAPQTGATDYVTNSFNGQPEWEALNGIDFTQLEVVAPPTSW